MAAVPADAPVTIAPGGRALIPTGIAIALPKTTEGQVRPRSGLAARHGVTVLNAPGTIDADYRGEIHVILVNLGSESFASSAACGSPSWSSRRWHAPSFWRSTELDKTRRGTGVLARPANGQLTKSGKFVRNIIIVIPYNGSTVPAWCFSPARVLLAIAAVIDVVLHGRGRPVSAKALGCASRAAGAPSRARAAGAGARRHSQRHQGPRGGYELARERRRITADDILRAAGTIEDVGDPAAGSALLNEVVIPARGQAERRSRPLSAASIWTIWCKGRAAAERLTLGVRPATPGADRHRSRSGLFRRDSPCA